MACWRQNDATVAVSIVTCENPSISSWHLFHRKVTVSDCMPISLHKMDIWFLFPIQGGREPDSRWVFNTLYKDFEIKLCNVFLGFFVVFFYSRPFLTAGCPVKNHYDPSADPLFARQLSGCICSCLLSAEPWASVARRWNLQSAFFRATWSECERQKKNILTLQEIR